MKWLAWVTGVVVSVLAVLFILWQFRSAVWLFLFSLAAAATVRPFLADLTGRGIPLKVALFLVYGLVILLTGGVLLILGLFISPELQQLANDLAITYQHILAVWPQGTPLQQAIVTRLPPSDLLYETLVGEQGTFLLQTALGVTSNLIENIAYVIIVIVLSIYWTVDQIRFERLWLSLLSVEYRAYARDIWREIESQVGAYARSELIQGLLAGFLLGAGYRLLGLAYPTLLALIGAVVWLIPIMGAVLAVIPAAVVGLMSSPLLGLLASGYTLAVFLILERFLEPRFFDRRRLSSLLLVLMIIIFIDSFGLIGFILAPPVALTIQILFRQLQRKRLPLTTAKPVPPLEDLRNRVTALEETLAGRETESSPKVTNMLERLNRLLQEAADSPAAAAIPESALNKK